MQFAITFFFERKGLLINYSGKTSIWAKYTISHGKLSDHKAISELQKRFAKLSATLLQYLGQKTTENTSIEDAKSSTSLSSPNWGEAETGFKHSSTTLRQLDSRTIFLIPHITASSIAHRSAKHSATEGSFKVSTCFVPICLRSPFSSRHTIPNPHKRVAQVSNISINFPHICCRRGPPSSSLRLIRSCLIFLLIFLQHRDCSTACSHRIRLPTSED